MINESSTLTPDLDECGDVDREALIREHDHLAADVAVLGGDNKGAVVGGNDDWLLWWWSSRGSRHKPWT